MPGMWKNGKYYEMPAFRHDSKHAPGRSEDEYYVWNQVTETWEYFNCNEKAAESRFMELMSLLPKEKEKELTEDKLAEINHKVYEAGKELRSQQDIDTCKKFC